MANDVDVDGWRASAFVGDPEAPAMIALAHGETTFLVLSYELEPEELAAIAGTVVGVDKAAWIEAGGVVL